MTAFANVFLLMISGVLLCACQRADSEIDPDSSAPNAQLAQPASNASAQSILKDSQQSDLSAVTDTSISLEQQQLNRERSEAFSEGMVLSMGAKASVSEYFATYGRFPGNNAQVGLAAPEDIRGIAVKSIEVIDDGLIMITYNGLIGRENDTAILIPRPLENGRVIQWDCSGGSVPHHYRPRDCAKTEQSAGATS